MDDVCPRVFSSLFMDMSVLTRMPVQLRFLQDLHGSADNWWHGRGQEEAVGLEGLLCGGIDLVPSLDVRTEVCNCS